MFLSQLCHQMTKNTVRILPKDHPLGSRLICPEYSRFVQDVKTYPFIDQTPVFALCWNMEPSHNLYSTLCPLDQDFSYHYQYKNHEKTQLHTHDYLELSYIVEGEFTQKILDKEITFSKGDLCLIDKNCLHQDYLENSAATILFFGITNETFLRMMEEHIITPQMMGFLKPALLKQKNIKQYLHFRPLTDSLEHIEHCIYQLLLELRNHTIGSNHICYGLLTRIFHILETEYETIFLKEQQKHTNWLMFEDISNYIQTHIATISIQELVKVFHFQEDYFNRLIRNKTGLTYSAYVQQIRLEQAKHLLATSKMTIEEVANAVGYHNKGYFYKIFQEKYGSTPAKWRKNNVI